MANKKKEGEGFDSTLKLRVYKILTRVVVKITDSGVYNVSLTLNP